MWSPERPLRLALMPGPDRSDGARRARALAAWLAPGAHSGALRHIMLELGAAPEGPDALAAADDLCSAVRAALPAHVRLDIAVKAAAATVTPGLVYFLARQGARVLLNVDGLDDAATSAFAAALELLQRAVAHDLMDVPVVRWHLDGAADPLPLYRTLVEQFGVRELDLVLPEQPGHLLTPDVVERITAQVEAIYAHWRVTRPRDLSVPLFDHWRTSLREGGRAPALSVRVDGDGQLFADDGAVVQPGPVPTLATLLLEHFLVMCARAQDGPRIAVECADCAWVGVCRSGSSPPGGLRHRYHLTDGYARRSAFCSLYDRLYRQLAAESVQAGMPQRQLLERLKQLQRSLQ